MPRLRKPLALNLALLLGAFVLSVAIGAVFIPPSTLLADLLGSEMPASVRTILYEIRLPHSILVALTGAALAGSGATYQGLFRNPLADPYLIGVASGAGLGAVFIMANQWPSTLGGFYTVPAAAFLGALIAVALVYGLARMGGSLPVTTLILAGVAISSFASALTSFLMLRSEAELRRAIAWLLGGASLSGWQPVIAVLPYVALGLGVLLFSGHLLNVLQLGDEQAEQVGLPVERVKLFLILAATLTTAAAVAFSGVIAFLGLIVPHAVRLLWGADHRRLLPLSMLAGASTLLITDILARSLFAPQVLPLGIITALAGAPFFIWLLRRAKAQMYW
ncbi:MAG: iron ABC transporter permease [Chloroflexi bacterium]|nr:iron ABC transporter permease [Chloroflexota bacterium]